MEVEIEIERGKQNKETRKFSKKIIKEKDEIRNYRRKSPVEEKPLSNKIIKIKGVLCKYFFKVKNLVD